MKEISFNGMRMRKHFASNYWITEDGNHLKVIYIDKITGIEKSFSLVVSTLISGRRYVKDRHDNIHYCDEMVATCFLPKPSKSQVLIHIDGKIGNDHYKNLKWENKSTPNGIHPGSSFPSSIINSSKSYLSNSSNTGIRNSIVTLPNGLTVTQQGEIFQNGKKLDVKEYKYDPYEGTKYKPAPYVVYKDSKNGKKKAISMDTLMSMAGYVKGDKMSFNNPVILHIDNDPMNFISDNLEWIDQSDTRYQTYKTIKNNYYA